MKTSILSIATISTLFLTLVTASNRCLAQQAQQADNAQNATVDPISQLNLSPEQREQIRTIRQEVQGDRVLINQRLREANRSFEEAMETENPDEALVEQRVKELASAQAAQMRMRALMEVRIRRVLTPDQRVLLRNLRQTAKDQRRERALQEQQGLEQRSLRERRNLLRQLPRDGKRPFRNRS